MFRLSSRKKVAELELRISVVIEPDGDQYHAYVPAFKGLHVDGKTEEEAAKNAQDAVMVYFRSLMHHHDPLPIGPDLTVKYRPIETPASHARLRSIIVQWPSLQMSGIS